MTLPRISKDVARRFVLGRQGLWPGRRWAGKAGTAQALQAIEVLQVDPLNVVARNHDLTLLSRVANYQPEYLDELIYRDRLFFDYGGTVFIRPMSELPYWRVVMRQKGQEARWANFAAQHPEVLAAVKRELRARGPLGNRDFEGQSTRVSNFRSGKDTGLALYYLWLTGDLMTHHRQGFDRIYDFRRNIAPPHLDRLASVAAAERFLILKQIAWLGFCRRPGLLGWLERKTTPAEAERWANTLIEAGEITTIAIEGRPDPYYLLTADLPNLTALTQGRQPKAWRPLGPSTREEVTFLAPLDIVSARGRAKILFDFDYVWEVYKPAEKRRWGYYTLPILYDDQLVARLDPKFDRETGTLFIQGFWLEQARLGRTPEFAEALTRGLVRLVQFVRADRLEVSAVKPAALRRHIQSMTRELQRRFIK